MCIFHLPNLWNMDAWIKGLTWENCFLAKAGGITLTVKCGVQSSNPTECLEPLATQDHCATEDGRGSWSKKKHYVLVMCMFAKVWIEVVVELTT